MKIQLYFNRAKIWILPIFALLFVSLNIIGTIRYYSPIPYQDMWDGYINFYLQVLNNNTSVWWAQHNEHRILFSRIFFWLDIRFFGGKSLLLFLLNFILIGLIWLTLLLNGKLLLQEIWKKDVFYTTASLLAIVCFSWLQKENFTWAFQSQFFAVYLFPLLAFFMLGLSASKHTLNNQIPKKFLTSQSCFAASVIFGITATGTMANGVIALPLLILMALLLHQSKLRLLILFLFSSLILALYLHGYSSPGQHGSIIHSLIKVPLSMANYFITYLGNFIHTVWLAKLMGIFFLVGFGFSTMFWIRKKNTDPMYLVPLIFIIYILATDFITAGGRVNFGIGQALSSRYQTPTLLGWSALGLLLISQIYHYKKFRVIVYFISIIVPISLLGKQFQTLNNEAITSNHVKNLALLALELKVNDPEAIQAIYPRSQVADEIFTEAKRKNISTFNAEKYTDVISRLNQFENSLPLYTCQNALNSATRLNEILPVVSHLKGWVFDSTHNTIPHTVIFINSSGKIVGIGITGAYTPDAKKFFNKKAAFSGFDGYVFGDTANIKIKCLK